MPLLPYIQSFFHAQTSAAKVQKQSAASRHAKTHQLRFCATCNYHCSTRCSSWFVHCWQLSRTGFCFVFLQPLRILPTNYCFLRDDPNIQNDLGGHPKATVQRHHSFCCVWYTFSRGHFLEKEPRPLGSESNLMAPLPFTTRPAALGADSAAGATDAGGPTLLDLQSPSIPEASTTVTSGFRLAGLVLASWIACNSLCAL